MKINQATIDLIKHWEGCYLKSYQDAVGVWTIGFGITSADRLITGTTIKKGMKISQATAEKWLMDSLEMKYAPKVMKYDHIYHYNENQFGALLSFCYNIGSIDQLTAYGTRSLSTIADKMLLYKKAGGKVLEGLRQRRIAERELFLTPVGKKKTIYFPTYTGKKEGIVDILDEMGYDSSYNYRAKLAVLNEISNYKGTADQNTNMVRLIKAGKLIKEVS